ncbi:MAG: site-specific integrase [Actinobacteria bacterium]|nr:site-specific integrase [Actinomycetota bacterium]
MGIDRLSSGAWRVRVQVEGRRVAATFVTKREAEEWEVLTRAKAITTGLPGRMTVAEYASRWIEGYRNSPANTRRFHQVNLDHWILPHLGPRPAAEVTPTDITTLLNRVTDAVSASRADRVYRTLSVLFRSAEADDVITRTPTRAKRHRPRRQKTPHAVLERPAARAVLLQMRGWQRDTGLLQLSLGARFGEIAGLTPHDVDLRSGTITIRRRVSRGTVRATKNHRQRTLELPRSAVATCERLIRESCDAPPLPDLGDREHAATEFDRRWLIQTSTGRSACLTSFNRALHAACEAAGTPDLSSHGLRHTYVSWMIDEGHSADKIAFWIGDTPQTVRAVYAHMLEASSAPAAAAIDAALGDLA